MHQRKVFDHGRFGFELPSLPTFSILHDGSNNDYKNLGRDLEYYDANMEEDAVEEEEEENDAEEEDDAVEEENANACECNVKEKY